MPTGYTDIIDSALEEGKTVKLSDYVWRCARAFGALVKLRDEPFSKKLKLEDLLDDETGKDSYHRDKIEPAKKRLEKALKMGDDECARCAAEEYAELMSDHEKMVKAWARLNAEYESMRDKVKGWEPPTPDHENLKKFMLEQLETGKPYEPRDPPKPMSAGEWRAAEVERAKWDLEYHSENLAKEVGRNKERNGWVRALIESVGKPG